MSGAEDAVEELLNSSLQRKLAEKTAALATAAEVGKIILAKNAALERALKQAHAQLKQHEEERAQLRPELIELRRMAGRYKGGLRSVDGDKQESISADERVELEGQVSALQAELRSLREQKGELSAVGSTLECELERVNSELKGAKTIISLRDQRIAEMQTQLKQHEAEWHTRLERVSALLFEASADAAAAKLAKETALEELKISEAMECELKVQVRELQHQADELEQRSGTPRCPGTPVQRMSLLSEIEAHLILRISQLTHDTLQKLGDRRSLMQPPLMAAVDETDELTQDDLAKIVEAALREYREQREATGKLGGLDDTSDGTDTQTSTPLSCSRSKRRSRDLGSPGAALLTPQRLSAASLDSMLSNGAAGDDDALHEFFVMCCNAINLGRINQGRLALARVETEQIYMETKQAEVPLHEWYQHASVEMERRALRLEDLDFHDSHTNPPELHTRVELSATELEEALAQHMQPDVTNQATFIHEVRQVNGCPTQ